MVRFSRIALWILSSSLSIVLGWDRTLFAEPPAVELTPSCRVEFASRPVAAQLLGQDDDFTEQLSGLERQIRLKSKDPVTTQQFLAYVSAQTLDWEPNEITAFISLFTEIRRRLEPLRLRLPDTIQLIKTTGNEEGGAAYTRGTAIILPAAKVNSNPEPLTRLLLHELFHVFSRHNPEARDTLYDIIGFHRFKQLEWPPELAALKITNPDSPLLEHAIRVQYKGREIWVVPATMTKSNRFDGGDLFSALQFRLLVVTGEPGLEAVMQVNDNPHWIEPANVPDYQRQIGRNTDYIIHPEEIFADNFVQLALTSEELPDPWVVDRMRDVLQCFQVKPVTNP